ncbi:MAG: exodeoxyribonuclease VII large subunit [Firmicutes bacterium]|nr:exodeoxyribonuclease VII large subunit [Bacillota bacterium]
MGRSPIRAGQLNQYIGRILRTDPILSDVSVIGEISNLKFHSSGHVYFSLKDDRARVNCFLPARVLPQITCPMEEGMEIVASGYVSVYERGGSYSLNVNAVEMSGIGQLAIQFEQLKKKLSAEGLFDPANKKPLPEFPLKVAIVTSPTGAAVQDMLKIIRSRNDVVSVLICPVLVQGPAAPADIAAAIDELNRDHPDVDVIITGRGGGSTEELWAFNEEVVARSIFASDIPVISAVGHETDVTISDFVADVRAETPTAAAQMAVPDTGELKEQLDCLCEDLGRDLLRQLQVRQQKVEALNPAAFAMGLETRMNYEQMHLDRLAEQMSLDMNARIEEGRRQAEQLREIVETASPYRILDRGYAMVSGPGGRVIRSIRDLKPGDRVSIRTAGGSAGAEILDTAADDLI